MISYSTLFLYGGLGFTLGTFLKQAEIAKISTYAIYGGAVLYILENFLGISI